MKKQALLILLAFIFAASINSALNAQALGPQSMADHTIGLHIDGTVYCWGRNTYGQLGDSTTTNRETPIKVLKGAYSGTTYLGDNSNNKITAVALGWGHSVALAMDGLVYTWGYNHYGQLGDGTGTQRETPIKVLAGAYGDTSTYLGGNSSNKITAVAMGEYHSIALAADGTVFSWGRNNDGQLGSTAQQTPPVKVLKGAYGGSEFLGDDSNNKITAVALGENHSIALAADGTVYSWGNNDYGQLGDNTEDTDRLIPVKVLAGAYGDTSTYLGGNSSNKITAVALGAYHSIALASNGTVYSWGLNEDGQIGDSSTTQRATPIKVLKGAYSGTMYLGDNSSNKITAVALGAYHSIALADDGTVYSWGRNSYGHLGDGTEDTDRLVPVKVLAGAYGDTSTYLGGNSNNKITAVALGAPHSMALAADGTVYCWGRNIYGNLGDNTFIQRNTPIKVKGIGGTGDLSLPVELTSFTARQEKGQVILAWITESETENLGFILERRNWKLEIGNSDWEEIASYIIHLELRGQGSVTSRTEYQFTDPAVQPGWTYEYRLTDVD